MFFKVNQLSSLGSKWNPRPMQQPPKFKTNRLRNTSAKHYEDDMEVVNSQSWIPHALTWKMIDRI